MSSINRTLADYFGNPTGAEKTASAPESTLTDQDIAVWQAFEKRAAADGIDVNDDSYTDEEIDSLYEAYANEGEATADNDAQVEFPPNWTEQDVEHFNGLDEGGQETFAQFKEAEFLGEVVAHSQFATLRKLAAAETEMLEKEAKKGAPLSFALDRMGRQVSDTAGKARKRVGEAFDNKRRKELNTTIKAYQNTMKGMSPSDPKALHANEMTEGLKKMRRGDRMIRGGAAAVGTGAVAAPAISIPLALKKKKQQEKRAAAIDTLALNRAENFLKLASGDQEVEFHDFGDAEEAVDQRAAEILVENGYGELLEQ